VPQPPKPLKRLQLLPKKGRCPLLPDLKFSLMAPIYPWSTIEHRRT
jgi:hypothetical protein